jgi:hypothetical protein
MPFKRVRRTAAATDPATVPRPNRAPGVLGVSIYRTTKLLIKVAASGMVLLFGWLKLSGTDFAPIVKQVPAHLLLQSSLALYYACWVAGTVLDTDRQEQIYSTQPNEGRVPPMGYGLVGGIAAVFAILCFVRSAAVFAVFLNAFFVINIIGWRYIIRRILPAAVRHSKTVFADAPFKLERVHLIYDRYMCGRWQVLRFVAGGIVLAILNVVAFSNIAETDSIKRIIGSRDLAISSLVLCFVLVMESWIWLVRLRVGAALTLLEYLDERYGHAFGKAV